MRTAIVFSMIVASVAAGACGARSSSTQLPTSRTGLARVRIDGGARPIAAEVADTDGSRTLGLGGRDALADGAGMLFVFPRDTTPGFWMKDMRFPLDMVWIDAGKRVIGVTADVQPQPGATDNALALYQPPSPVQYVLELSAGAAARLGLAAGKQLSFALPSAAE